MLIIKQIKNESYKVKHLFENFSDVQYSTFDNALNLCRLRCHKMLNDDNLKVVKIPFNDLWLVW
jgi:hypothetical protein